MLGDTLIPPSSNWFINHAVDSRSEDGIVITASFKALVVYKAFQTETLPKVLKIIYFSDKVSVVRIYPLASHAVFGRSAGFSGDSSNVKLINFESGDIIGHHEEHQDSTVNGLSWGMLGEEPALVSVDSKCRMVVWQAGREMTKVHKFTQYLSELTCVEVDPNDQGRAVVGGGKTLIVVGLKDGSVLMQFHGHNSEVYCVKWFQGNNSPFYDCGEKGHSSASVETVPVTNGKDTNSSKGSDSDNWRSSPPAVTSDGPFLASSDYGRQIFLWDLSAKRYVAEVTVPQSGAGHHKKFQGKDKAQAKSHISLAWHNGQLISSTPKGELLMWKLWPSGGRYSLIHHLHYRAIYNLAVVGDIVISFSQDRFMQGCHLPSSEHMFQYPTLGACASTLAFCPQDMNRLAIGSQENVIRFLNFEGRTPLQCSVIWQNVKGKVLSIAWHPDHEGRLLFGTASGQVGWVDMSSGRVTTCAYYHQKSVYKVEWAPLICPEKIGLQDAWCAYSFGDKEIVVRSSSDAMADPVQLLPLLKEPDESKPVKDVTEFSFSCDYKYLAIGTSDGQVRVYSTSDLSLVVSLLVFRKAIQHVLWQPPPNASPSYIVAVSSNEHKVGIFDLSQHLQKGDGDATVITQATRELSGHESRVVWLAWSPHKPEVLASASYDHTVQLWDSSTGQPMVNYGGHTNRVFRTEFSPSDPDLMYSFAEENSVHTWKPSQLTCKTAAESLANAKERHHLKKGKDRGIVEEQADKETSSLDGVEKKSVVTNATGEKTSLSSSTLVTSNKRSLFKSFFPKLHAITTKKKSFYNIVILNLLAMWKANLDESPSSGKEIEEDLSDDLQDSADKGERCQMSDIDVEAVCKKYAYLQEKETETPEVADFVYALNLYGKPLQMDSILTSEISEHTERGHDIQADLMHCWRGSLDEHIRSAARQKKLNPFLVSSAPQVSIKLWEFASEAYAKQLVEEGDIISAATYLVNIDQVEEAVEVLMKHRFFREALAIAKCRRGYSEELIMKITSSWAASTIFEGNYGFSAAFQVSHGLIEEAASTLARRNDHCSLFVSSVLYSHAGKKDLSNSIGLLAFKEACLKQDHEKLDLFLSDLPELQWFQVISSCHAALSNLVQEAMSEESPLNYMVCRKKDKSTEEAEVDSSTTNDVAEMDSSPARLPFLQYLIEEFGNIGFTKEDYSLLYETVISNMSTQQMPTSVKQLWFLVSVAICEMVLSPTSESWKSHLSAALDYVLSWGKADQIFHLTHILLPKGTSDLTSVVPKNLEYPGEDCEVLGRLQLLYNYSELQLLYLELQNEDAWNHMTNKNSSSEEKADATNSSVEPNSSVNEEQGDSLSDSSGKEIEVVSDSNRVENGQDHNTVEGKVESNAGKDKQVVNADEVKLKESGVRKFSGDLKTTSDLLSKLVSLIDLLSRNKAIDVLKEKFSESMLEPKDMLLNISMKLKETGNVREEDILFLLSKISAFKS